MPTSDGGCTLDRRQALAYVPAADGDSAPVEVVLSRKRCAASFNKPHGHRDVRGRARGCQSRSQAGGSQDVDSVQRRTRKA